MKKYILQATPKSRCGHCNGGTHLLCNDHDPTRTAWFWICWKCKRVFQTGVGEVGKSFGRETHVESKISALVEEMRSAVDLSHEFGTPVADRQLILDWAQQLSDLEKVTT